MQGEIVSLDKALVYLRYLESIQQNPLHFRYAKLFTQEGKLKERDEVASLINWLGTNLLVWTSAISREMEYDEWKLPYMDTRVLLPILSSLQEVFEALVLTSFLVPDNEQVKNLTRSKKLQVQIDAPIALLERIGHAFYRIPERSLRLPYYRQAEDLIPNLIDPDTGPGDMAFASRRVLLVFKSACYYSEIVGSGVLKPRGSNFVSAYMSQEQQIAKKYVHAYLQKESALDGNGDRPLSFLKELETFLSDLYLLSILEQSFLLRLRFSKLLEVTIAWMQAEDEKLRVADNSFVMIYNKDWRNMIGTSLRAKIILTREGIINFGQFLELYNIPSNPISIEVFEKALDLTQDFLEERDQCQ